MLIRLQSYFSKIKPVTVDGTLYVLIAVFGTLVTITTSDDAYKYFNPYILYYTRCAVEVLLAGVSALKMFRSTSYSEHIKEKENEKANTSFVVKPTP